MLFSNSAVKGQTDQGTGNIRLSSWPLSYKGLGHHDKNKHMGIVWGLVLFFVICDGALCYHYHVFLWGGLQRSDMTYHESALDNATPMLSYTDDRQRLLDSLDTECLDLLPPSQWESVQASLKDMIAGSWPNRAAVPARRGLEASSVQTEMPPARRHATGNDSATKT